ncbi:patatin-like phospholipase family protein [Microvirga brassicacearum]|uniref:Patatin-like phospholipase family protein n=1 Tax=Microvirga brassicacearum TaxID=2580413 RepID=A0A5N3P354_9HYPH|nr:patatin-like phospholipase family protein [Microvirga brassicacearum]KAB0264168.1 patatin-like phospholipase family protein [Microvirga brassicacearum]
MPESPLFDEAREPEAGIALCLSGGGYRAMLFHLGSLVRLNEVSLLSKLSRISSVSGGSITAAYLGLRWKDLAFDGNGRAAALDLVIDKIREMASTSVDAGAVIGGILLPGSISDRVARAYDETLFDGATLADLPGDGAGPRFVINATNVQSGAVWRFSKAYMGDYRVGLVPKPTVKLAVAVAASSAFPPVLSPLNLPIDDPFDPTFDGDLSGPAYRKAAVLSDGGVYDNLGLETAFKRFQTLLVSDGGKKIAPEEDPSHDWARHSIRVLDIIDNQVRSLRKRQLIDAFEERARTGAYWGIRTLYADYAAPSDPLGCTHRDPTALAEIPTRLQALPDPVQEKLINWGYAITDAALRVHFGQDLRTMYRVTIPDPTSFPYPGGY